MSSVEERLQRVEDQMAIYQLVCGYGYAADGCNQDALGQIYAQDGVYAIGDVGAYEGRAAVQGIVAKQDHIDLVTSGAAHMSTLPYVVIEGDNAVATCHTMIMRHDGKGFTVWRVSASRIECVRRPSGGWEIKHRQNDLLQDDLRGSRLLARFMEGPTQDRRARR